MLPKYIPLYDKAFADAHAMSVPAHMEAKKNELIDRQESNYKMMKMAYEAYQEKKSNPDTADDDDDGDEADEDDEDESRGCARQMPRLIVPPPELAKTDEEYFRCVAEPFYNKNIVDVYDAASETNMVVREKTLVVRKALARNCALVTPEFPLASDKAAADWLWKHGSRDAAAAIVRFEGSDPDFKYWQGEKLFAEAMKVVDSKRDPLLRLLLARAAYRNIKKQHSRYPQHKPERLVKDAYVLFNAAFTNAIPLLSASENGWTLTVDFQSVRARSLEIPILNIVSVRPPARMRPSPPAAPAGRTRLRKKAGRDGRRTTKPPSANSGRRTRSVPRRHGRR